MAAFCVAAWYLFPPDRRAKNEFKRKYPKFLYYRLAMFVMVVETYVLRILLKILSPIEWISAILIPIYRSSNTWIFSKIVRSIAGSENEAANCLVTTNITLSAGFFIAIGLFNLSQFTVYCILCVELLLHMRTCYQIIRMSKRIEQEPNNAEKANINEESRSTLLDLVISELIETMIPLILGLGYASAYYGPNANLIRNVGTNLFGAKIMKDIQYFYIVMLELFAIDLVTMMLTTICLYRFCRINVFQEFCKSLKKYWWMMMLQLCTVPGYFGTHDINFAIDFSGKFQWITDEGISDLLRNSNEYFLNEEVMLLANMTRM